MFGKGVTAFLVTISEAFVPCWLRVDDTRGNNEGGFAFRGHFSALSGVQGACCRSSLLWEPAEGRRKDACNHLGEGD